ncbi:Bug family tripartite tricarboxylate transporter substrate binding protein [Pseudorhodoplanes sinuspersici]|nr:tripartite tricarboxylate transporter substrate binding protein [Pseudorhodoplanes sinuspersici]RKE74302.1 tripartite-type tricarboxylate transporter receptor subunit TctC [Pseudorhodoplanes sinuspersici]
MTTRRIVLASIAALSTALLPATAFAQSWPQKPVTVIVPFAAGGNTDGIARMVAQKLTEGLNQQFVVENKGGAGGALAADFVARAQPDGYTLFLTAHSVLTVVPKMMKVKYDPLKDFATISNVATNPFVLVVHKDMPVNNVAEFVKYVKAQKDKVSYASAGQGSLAHLSMALFLKEAGIDMVHVPYKGNAPALSDVIAGHVPAMFSNLSDTLPHAAGGNLKLLAVSGDKRAPQLPNVPTVAESGYPKYKSLTWNALMAPAGTPKEVVDKAAKVVIDAVKDPKFAEKLAGYGVDPLGNTPEQFAKELEGDVALWASALEAAGIKQQ